VDVHVGYVRGERIKWVREQLELTMRQVKERGGPSLGYQSEVEHGKKVEVRSDVLSDWIRTLGVNESFVRGEIPRYIDDPAACRGLAADVAHLIASGQVRHIEWVELSGLERARQVLWLVSTRSRKLPRVVLAWVLGIEVATLDAMVNGQVPLVQWAMQSLVELTTLSEEFFKFGVVGRLSEEAALETAAALAEPDAVEQAYRDIIDLALRRGLTPAGLRALVLGD
jgi:transcriptional regulator with XRE-family HTH domain